MLPVVCNMAKKTGLSSIITSIVHNSWDHKTKCVELLQFQEEIPPQPRKRVILRMSHVNYGEIHYTNNVNIRPGLTGTIITIRISLLYHVKANRTFSKYSSFYYNQSTVPCRFNLIIDTHLVLILKRCELTLFLTVQTRLENNIVIGTRLKLLLSFLGLQCNTVCLFFHSIFIQRVFMYLFPRSI